MAKLPYDVKATAFQRRVWDHLRTIPEGQTRHYSEIASAIGQPKASRAFAHACATNPVAIIVIPWDIDTYFKQKAAGAFKVDIYTQPQPK